MLLLAAGAIVSLVVGLATEALWGWVLFGLAMAALVLYHLRELARLRRWLGRGETPEPPRARGAWDELHAALQRSLRESARREAELAHAVERWREAARALPDGVVILDGERIAWLNDNAALHLEIDPGRDVGNPITHLVRIPEFVEYLESGDYARPIQVQAAHSDRALSLQVIAYGEDQRLVLSRDITQFRKVEQVRREFVANVSHELRTPLTVISGFLETLREETDPQAAGRYIAMMSEQASRMQRLVEDLLTLSSLESAPPPPLEQPVEMEKLVERLGAEARALSGGRHRIEVESEAQIDLMGSEKELSSAFGNLVSNAIRYTPEGGTVRLTWHRTDDGAAFDVEDTGIGIAPEHIPRLTERFYRVDRGRSRETGGTGLGLAIVKHALARHGAALDVASAPGKGSRFSARFSGPRVRRRPALPPASP
ncbi:MAG TPA: phosphate regulon sensor histidine kinase PhoR, partial [Usitatibacter sp.]|nr:phosphate regulon sensor histidine kinase PhoR [Usitatibacter sp.]